MGLWQIIRGLLGSSEANPYRAAGAPDGPVGRGSAAAAPSPPKRSRRRPPKFFLADLALRLGRDSNALSQIAVEYETFSIAKRSGGRRTIHAPQPGLKALQRDILRKVLGGLKAHPAVNGFRRGRSIVTNALPHVGHSVLVRLDIRDFFPSTTARRVEEYFRFIGYDDSSAALLTRICTHQGALPQGAPTSPCLSNLLNYRLDARLSALAAKMGATYTRYADDMAFSFSEPADAARVNMLVSAAQLVLSGFGYRTHHRRKRSVRRRHMAQCVTGIVVNDKANLPRATRRRLRAVRHHLMTGKEASLTAAQLAGWDALQHMIKVQSVPPSVPQ
ncbi:MAG: reverse transcriptase family protein [Planctomycetaceae bacterium]|nr:reverse transcriptase family protein [Planctomycetaceae bacterium]